VPTNDDRWGQPVGLFTEAALGRPDRLMDATSLCPIRRPADVFHPPRLS
jgi:hypothetical protein